VGGTPTLDLWLSATGITTTVSAALRVYTPAWIRLIRTGAVLAGDAISRDFSREGYFTLAQC